MYVFLQSLPTLTDTGHRSDDTWQWEQAHVYFVAYGSNALSVAHTISTHFFSPGLSDRTQSTHRISDAEQKTPDAPALHKKPRPRATSFISARSAQQRDQAAEKWFTDVRKLDLDNVKQRDDLKSLPYKTRMGSGSSKQHEMRPRTDLNALFAAPTSRTAISSRLQSKRELGGDYTSYLPGGYADPYRHPVDYARLVLGRNKHIPLDAQTGALSIVGEAIRGRASRQGNSRFYLYAPSGTHGLG